MAIKKMARPDAAKVGQAQSADPAEKRSLPNVLEYLTLTEYDDGSPRLTSSVTIFVKDGTFRVVLNDKQEGKSLWGEGSSIVDALRSLEAELQMDTPPWKWDNKVQGQKGGARVKK